MVNGRHRLHGHECCSIPMKSNMMPGSLTYGVLLPYSKNARLLSWSGQQLTDSAYRQHRPATGMQHHMLCSTHLLANVFPGTQRHPDILIAAVDPVLFQLTIAGPHVYVLGGVIDCYRGDDGLLSLVLKCRM